MMNPGFASVALATASLFVIASPAVAAQTQSCASGHAADQTAAPFDCKQGQGVAVASQGSFAFLSPTNASVSAIARSQAAIGVLKASASVAADVPTGFRNYVGAIPSATASWGDSIIVNAGLRGTRGSFTALIAFNGYLQGGVTRFATPNNTGGAVSAVDFRGTGLSPINISLFTDEGSYSQSFNLLIPVTIDFVNGFVTNLGYSLSATASNQIGTEIAGSGVQSVASSNFGNSVLWGGITGVFDSLGQPVSEYTIMGETSFDYKTSLIPPVTGVPEPASWALLIAGFGLVGAALRRRRFVLPLEPLV